MVSGPAFGFIQDARANGIFNIVESPALMKKIILLQEDAKLTTRLKRPRWVVSDEGWEFYGKDKEHMVYIENSEEHIITIEFGLGSTAVYMNSLSPQNRCLVVTDEQRKKIKERIVKSYKLMGVNIELL